MTSKRPRIANRTAGMQNIIKAAVVALALAFAAPVAAQDFETGLEAYVRGDYAAALREWRLLAQQGDADAQYNFLGDNIIAANGICTDF